MSGGEPFELALCLHIEEDCRTNGGEPSGDDDDPSLFRLGSSSSEEATAMVTLFDGSVPWRVSGGLLQHGRSDDFCRSITEGRGSIATPWMTAQKQPKRRSYQRNARLHHGVTQQTFEFRRFDLGNGHVRTVRSLGPLTPHPLHALAHASRSAE